MSRDPVADLRDIAFHLERSGAASYRVKAFRHAADTLAELGPAEVAELARTGRLTTLPGIGEVTATCVAESLAGTVPAYLAKLADTVEEPLDEGAAKLLAALRGDCHTHTDWSDGGSPPEEMAMAALALGREYLVITDHSPRLTVARGLTAERLTEQLKVVAAMNEVLNPQLRVLTGIEVDIHADGTLDQTSELLDRLDVVVASVHSRLRDPSEVMTPRMLAAVADPHTDILGHCTGRIVRANSERAGGKTRPESEFDAGAVFAACAEHGVAVEINSRPDRRDPPSRLIRLALAAGCLFSIDSDAHAPGQLDWLRYGAARAAACGVPAKRIVNTWTAAKLLEWTNRHR